MLRYPTLAILAVVGLTVLPQFGHTSPTQDRSKGTTTTLTGVISDSMCGAQHMVKDKSAADCTRECVKQGSDYALVVGNKVYILKGNTATLDKYAGQKVTVKGTVSGNTINAELVSPA